MSIGLLTCVQRLHWNANFAEVPTNHLMTKGSPDAAKSPSGHSASNQAADSGCKANCDRASSRCSNDGTNFWCSSLFLQWPADPDSSPSKSHAQIKPIGRFVLHRRDNVQPACAPQTPFMSWCSAPIGMLKFM